MYASPENITVPMYSPAIGPNPKWNFSLMVSDLTNVMTIAFNAISLNTSAAIITNYYQGPGFTALGLSEAIGYWNATNGEIIDLTGYKTSKFNVTTPLCIWYVEVEGLDFTDTSVVIDIYTQYAAGVLPLLTGDCPYDHTIYMTSIKTNTITVDSTNYNVTTTSNSTVSATTFDKDGKAINFTTNGPASTTGYVNVTIPKTLLNAALPDWVVTMDDAALPSSSIRVINENASHTFIYINYTQSTHNMRIVGTWVVPEFPSTTILLTLLATMTIALAFIRKIHKKPRKTL